MNGVKGDLATTNNNLQMARGELGTLIAKNHDEIDELRRLGERDYYEFTLSGKGNKSKAGSLMIELRGTNPKKNQFTRRALRRRHAPGEEGSRSRRADLLLHARHASAARVGCEPVGKDKVVGYVSMPKPQPTGQPRLPRRRRRVSFNRTIRARARFIGGQGQTALPVFLCPRSAISRCASPSAACARLARPGNASSRMMPHGRAGHLCPSRVHSARRNRRRRGRRRRPTDSRAVGPRGRSFHAARAQFAAKHAA